MCSLESGGEAREARLAGSRDGRNRTDRCAVKWDPTWASGGERQLGLQNAHTYTALKCSGDQE